jgi:hypothetical protein
MLETAMPETGHNDVERVSNLLGLELADES